MATGVSVVLVSVPNETLGLSMARTLLDEGLIACANLVPGVRSLYRWKGDVCDESEVLLVLKVPSAGFDVLRARILRLHPYETPEVLQLEVAAGHQAYLDWVLDASPRR